MEDKFQNKYRVSSPRLAGWDYGSHGLYFITVCTKDRVPYFGEVVATDDNATIKYSDIGLIVYHHWLQIPDFHPYVHLDEFVIMPDHIHGILFFNKPDKQIWEANKFGGQQKNLASVVRGLKAAVKSQTIKVGLEFNWQPRYYDRVIRNQKEYENIRKYIYDNPENWVANKDGFENLYL